MKPIDVYILTGFVGAGKTTALNGLLRNQTLVSTNPALIINEFGKIGVDGALVEQRDLTRYEINKGSIFCICTKTDFLKALSEIVESGVHQTLLIEATGIAETSRPLALKSEAAFSPSSSKRDVMITVASASAKPSVMHLPYLPLPPVTKTILSCKLNNSLTCISYFPL